jgi:hypothetical protein
MIARIPSAKAAAPAVERKLTASLLSQPRRSRVAPRRLSKSRPNIAPAVLIQKRDASPRSARVPARATMTPAAMPARVPAMLMAPSTPGSAVR